MSVSDEVSGDWPRLVRDLVETMARHEAQTERLVGLCDRLTALHERDVEVREVAAANERTRLAQVERQLDRDEDTRARAALAAAADSDRRRDWWDRACERGRAALGSPHVDRALSGSVGALLIILAWLVSRITGTTPPSLGGP